MMASSRVFIRGLPPSLNERDLKKHFDKFDPKDPNSTTLTDAHFIPHRRIGYVGYKTPEAAEKAVKYFNKTFIRMSRIAAELARPVDDQEQERARKRRKVDDGPPNKDDKPSSVKEPAPHDERLSKFVDTLQDISRGKVWSNQDTELRRRESYAVPDAEAASDDEYQVIDKKEARDHEQNGVLAAENRDEEPRRILEPVEQVVSEKKDVDDILLDDIASKPPPASDLDWLRSRTSRVLDLLEGDDIDSEMQKRAQGAPSSAKKEESSARVERTEPNDRDHSSKPADERDERDESHAQPPSARLLVRNILYDTTDDELLEHFKAFGSVDEVHVCYDSKSGKSKGFAFVQFETPEEASEARLHLDGKPFQGRNLHVQVATPKKSNGIDEIALAKLPLKVQNQIRRKAAASTENFKWNSLYMSTDAIMSSVATRLGVSKSDVLDPTSADAAVQQAHAETKTIQDTQSYFKKHGVDIDAFKQARRGGDSETAILVKNFPFGTTASDIKGAFEKHGVVKRLLVPSTATIAIVEMDQPTHARTAFRSLAYSKFKDSVLLLEKAPKSIFRQEHSGTHAEQSPQQAADPQSVGAGFEEEFEQQEVSITSSLFADKLPWAVTTERLRETFQGRDGFLSARVMTRSDPKKPGKILSRGFGFVEFRSKAQAKAAMLDLNGHILDGQPLILRPAQRNNDAAEERRKEDRDRKLASQGTKLVFKNLPFEATQKDIRALCSAYGQLRSVRLPKKMDFSSRGFAFVDFISAKEAANAMDALRNTHLLGRRLVIDFATTDAVDAEEEIQRMQRKVERQADKVANRKLTAGGRKKFRAYDQDDDEQHE